MTVIFPIVEIGFERITYTGSEADEITEQICVSILADPADFDGGSLHLTFAAIGITTITGIITPTPAMVANAATGKVTNLYDIMVCYANPAVSQFYFFRDVRLRTSTNERDPVC